MTRSFFLVLVVALALTACEQGTTRSAGPTVRDSAGVQIVENQAGRWADGRGWRVSAQPTLDIGVRSEDPNYQLYRVSGAVRLEDGRVVVANSGTGELRFYAASGEFLHSSGRRGGGPGEFQAVSSIVALAGDSLAVYDGRLRRVSLFDPNGGFLRSARLEAADALGFHTAAAFLGNGALLVSAEGLFAGGEMSEGLRRDTTFIIRCDMAGAVLDTVARLPGREMYVVLGEDGVEMAQLAFGREPRFAAYGGGFLIGSTDSYEIRYHTGDGTLTRIVRTPEANRAITPEDIELFMTVQLADMPAGPERQYMERFFGGMPFPETMPAHGNLLVDTEGNLWVEEYRWPLDEQPRWSVFGRDGALLGTVETPPGLELYQIGADFMLGRWRDDLDVEHVRLYRLLKD